MRSQYTPPAGSAHERIVFDQAIGELPGDNGSSPVGVIENVDSGKAERERVESAEAGFLGVGMRLPRDAADAQHRGRPAIVEEKKSAGK